MASKEETHPALKSSPVAPVVNPTTYDRVQSIIRRTQSPASVEAILHSAIQGDLRDQSLVFLAMMDTWPRLAKLIGEVAGEVRKSPMRITPFSVEGDEPTPDALAKAEAVELATKHLYPDPTVSHECDLGGLKERMVYGYYQGHSVSEIYIHPNKEVRAFRVLDPRNYCYPRFMQEKEDRLMLNISGDYNGKLTDFSDYPGRFLVGINYAHLGHASVAAPLRGLVSWWMASHFGLKWMLSFSQSFGTPIRWATYPNNDDETKSAVADMLENMGLLGWGAFPEGTNLDIKESAKSAGDLPQQALIEMADRQADIAILGQSLTTDVGNSGSRALGDVHKVVRQDMIDGVACWVADILTKQLVPTILGEQDTGLELPSFKVEWPEVEDERGMAERDQILLNSGVQMPKAWFYERHKIPEPEGEEEVIEGPAANPAPGNEEGPQGPPKKDKDGKPIEARNASPVDQLTDTVLESVSGEAAAFLSGVRPHFRNLVTAALDGSLSDDDLIKAIESAAVTMPELYQDLNVDSLEQALTEIIGTGLLKGVADRYKAN